jgi:two-component system NarL family response regulator
LSAILISSILNIVSKDGSEMKPLNELTKQEQQILALVANGRRNAKIAEELYISVRTVESHLYRVFRKLNVSSRTEAAVYAIHIGLLQKPELSGNTHARDDGSSYYLS